MSEPILSEKQRLDLAKYIAGWHFSEAVQRGLVVCAVAEIERLTVELAALAPLQDLLKDVREDNELRRASEIGAAQEREIIRTAIQDQLESAAVHEPKGLIVFLLKGVIETIDKLGPCLPPLPDEAELMRLRNIEREAREMLRAADWFGQPGAKYAELRKALGMRSKETAPPI